MEKKPLICDLCREAFKLESSLRRHRRRCSSDKKEKIEPKRWTCNGCSKSFLKESNLSKHLNVCSSKKTVQEEPKRWVCDSCAQSFATKSSLKRHRRGCTLYLNGGMDPTRWICDLCGDSFSSKSCLSRHRGMRHSEFASVFECAECGSNFVRKDNLKRHIINKHVGAKFKKKMPKLVCDQCTLTFAHRGSLLRHIKQSHTCQDSIEYFECSDCGGKFYRKDSLRRHIRFRHLPFEVMADMFECNICSLQFIGKSRLEAHARSCLKRNDRVSKSTELKCLECFYAANTRKSLNVHYERFHNVIFVNETILFDTFDKFCEWKRLIHHKTVTQFIKKNEWKTPNCVVKMYICHRSGTYQTAENQDRKRNPKVAGSKKLGGHCPAEIIVKISQIDFTCVVKYQSTHVGHPTETVSELPHVYLDDEERASIAAEIQIGVSPAEIVKKQRLSANPIEKNSRMSVLTLSDVHNVAKRLGVDVKVPSRITAVNDTDSVDSLLEKNYDSVLFCKNQNQNDSKFQLLQNDDFMIVLMNKAQEENLRLYGGKIIAIEGTVGIEPHEFVLHTLLVLNVDFEGIPVAFALSNRNDSEVISIFFQCVKERVGVVEPKTLITDIQNTYHDIWISIMKPPDNYLFNLWQVLESWDANIAVVPNKKKKEELRALLHELAYEQNTDSFEEQLKSFLSIDDEDVKDFIEYFRQNYATSVRHWAFCYRKYAGIETNMNFDKFHRTLKNQIANGKKIPSLKSCLRFVLEHLLTKESKRRQSHINGKLTLKLAALRNRHQRAEVEFSKEMLIIIENVEEQSWQVGSFRESDDCVQEMFSITKFNEKTCSFYTGVSCRLPCISCNSCFHEYRCSCQDCIISNNMCKHIHALGIYLRNRSDFVNLPDKGEQVEYEQIDVAQNTMDQYETEQICIKEDETEQMCIEQNETEHILIDQDEMEQMCLEQNEIEQIYVEHDESEPIYTEQTTCRVEQVDYDQQNDEQIGHEQYQIEQIEYEQVEQEEEYEPAVPKETALLELRAKLFQEFEDALSMAKTPAQLLKLEKCCIAPIKPVLSRKENVTN